MCSQVSKCASMLVRNVSVTFPMLLQSKSNDEVAALGTKKIGYHPVLAERSGRKMVQRAMSLAQTK